MGDYIKIVVYALLFVVIVIVGTWALWYQIKQMKHEFKKLAILQAEEDIMTKGYCYQDSWFELLGSDELLAKLRKVNCYAPRIQKVDEMDIWYQEATHLLMHNGECLAHINHFGHLGDMFWENIKKCDLHPERDVKFQKLLISVYKADSESWMGNFVNLLFNYGTRYELLPEIEFTLISDPRFKDPKNTYYMARKCAAFR